MCTEFSHTCLRDNQRYCSQHIVAIIGGGGGGKEGSCEAEKGGNPQNTVSARLFRLQSVFQTFEHNTCETMGVSKTLQSLKRQWLLWSGRLSPPAMASAVSSRGADFPICRIKMTSLGTEISDLLPPVERNRQTRECPRDENYRAKISPFGLPGCDISPSPVAPSFLPGDRVHVLLTPHRAKPCKS